MTAGARSAAALPLLFVVLWSTGFIGSRLGLAHAPPLTFLLLRYMAVILVMTTLSFASRAAWPRGARAWAHIGVSGLLIHAVYLGGCFIAISKGLPAGVTSLVVGLQPLLTAIAASGVLGESVSRRQWIGLLMGLAGVALVVLGKPGAAFGAAMLLPAVVALFSITAGTIYQKRFCPAFDWRTGSVAQFVPTALVTAAGAWLTESMHVEWTGDFTFALAWLVVVLSIGAVSLLNWLIRHGDVSNVAALFYLVPPCTALMAWLLFHETLSALALGGMALAAWGVSLARR